MGLEAVNEIKRVLSTMRSARRDAVKMLPHFEEPFHTNNSDADRIWIPVRSSQMLVF